MRDDHGAAIAHQLDQYLQRERDALRAGKVEDLADLLPVKEVLLAKIMSDPPPAGALAGLREKAERNQELMAAAADGVRAVIEKLEAFGRAAGPIQSYSGSGAKETIGAVAPSVERKA